MLLRAEALARQIGERCLFAGVAFELRPRDRLGLVGPNGAGKTTLLRLLGGEEAPDAGRVLAPRRVRIGRLGQEVDPTLSHSVREEAARALAHLDALDREARELEARMAAGSGEPARALVERYDALRARFDAADGFRREARVERVLAGLGFGTEERGRPVRSFSGGWLMRIQLAKLLLAEPDVLLLDEPTNHLDLPAIEWLEGFLDAYRGAVVAVSHDRTFLTRHTTRIAELEHGVLTVYEGNWEAYLEQRAARREQAEARRRSEERRRAELERFVDRFRYKASKARQAQSRIKMIARMERDATEAPRANARRMHLRIPPPVRAGDIVLALEGVAQGYGETRVYEDLDLLLRRGDRVALVGPNGAGKSTLLRIAAGTVPIERGMRRLGHRVTQTFYAQHQLESLDPDGSVLGELERIAAIDDVPRLRGHLGAFLFSGDDVQKKVAVLSGGEKARLALARLLLRPANFLVLDEPTNHLDLAACEVLEDALRGYEGTLLFVSHDRAFVNAVATRVLEVRAGRLRDFTGNYDAYLKQSSATNGPAASGAIRSGGISPQAAAGGAQRAEGERSSSGRAAAQQGPSAQRTAGERSQSGRAAAQQGSNTQRAAGERSQKIARHRIERSLARVEQSILERESALEAIGWRMAEPSVHRDGERMRALEAERSALRAEVEALYKEWEGLAAELEDGPVA
ncbi:MAG TPA: ABC-F family ATP-binding cassette domain-containing protein [Myxococcota bacterium]|nr:ABC-F family ATP-binding cassette domain-containing protein [Myxococcota bacterium]